MANGNGNAVARRKKDKGKVWPWIVGALVPIVAGAAWFFWPSKAKAAEKDTEPLKSSDADQIPTLICAAWRAGDRGAVKIAATVAARLRPGFAFPADRRSGPNMKALWAEVMGAVETIVNNAAAQGVDVCEFLEGKPEPSPEPEPEPSPLGALPDPLDMRTLLSSINYDVSISNTPLNVPSIVTEGGQPGPGAVWLPNGFIMKFQSDWNAVVTAMKSGKIPKGQMGWTTWPPDLGKTGTDGIGGNKTKRRLEASASNQFAGHAWQVLVSEARA